MLVGRALLLGPLVLPPAVRLGWCSVGMCAAPNGSGDELLMAAMASLKERDGTEAARQLRLAREAYEAQPDGPSEEQQQLMGLVSERIDAAVMSRSNAARRHKRKIAPTWPHQRCSLSS